MPISARIVLGRDKIVGITTSASLAEKCNFFLQTKIFFLECFLNHQLSFYREKVKTKLLGFGKFSPSKS